MNQRFNCKLIFTFAYRSEPTKMDNDVLRALHDVEIDKNEYPNVYCWHNALMKYSLEERSRYAHVYFNLLWKDAIIMVILFSDSLNHNIIHVL